MAFRSLKTQLSFPDGELMYINHPDYRIPYRQMPWGGFACAYELTGDRQYLELPYPLIVELLKTRDFGKYGEGAFSYPMFGLLRFLQAADRARMLHDLQGN